MADDAAIARPDRSDARVGGSTRGLVALAILGILALSLAVRFLYLAQIQAVPFVEFPINDAHEYDAWARQIAEGDWLGSEAFYQAPAYPYFLAAIYTIGGPDLSTAHAVQMVMGALSCVVMFFVTRRLFGHATGVVAGVMLAVYPPAIYFDGIIGKISLGLFLFSLLLALLVGYQARDRLRVWKILAAGVVFGVLALTRENALVFGVAVPLWLGFRFRAIEWRTRAAHIAAFAVGAALILGSVGLRNYRVGDSFVLTTSQMGTNFYIGNNPAATGLYAPLIPGRNTPTYEASDAANLAEEALGRELSRAEVSDYWMSRGLDFVVSEPLRFLQLTALKVLYTWNEFEIADTEDIYVYDDWSGLLRNGLAAFHFGVLAPLAFAGFWLARRERRDAWLLVWLAVVYTAAVSLFIAFARFRFPLVPLLLPLAAYALVEGFRRWRAGEVRSLAIPALALALSAAIVNLELLDEREAQAASYLNLAGIMLNQRRENDALPYLEQAAALQPESAELEFHYAVYHFRQQRWREAESHLRKMIEAEVSDVRAHRLLVVVLKKQGRIWEAAQARRRVLELDPDRDVRHPPKANAPGVVPLGREVDSAP